MPHISCEYIRALEDLEDRIHLARSSIRFDLFHSLHTRRPYFATDRFGSELREGHIVETLTTTPASVRKGTIATLLKCRSGYGSNCWCTIQIWSGPKSGKTYSRKAKNLRKLITDNDD